MIIEKPYFMTNKHWYTFDFQKRIFVLTPNAPETAKESYKQYIKQLKG